MKRYLAFSGAMYYACGGMNDFVGDFDDLEEAKEAVRVSSDKDWWSEGHDQGHVYDSVEKIKLLVDNHPTEGYYYK